MSRNEAGAPGPLTPAVFHVLLALSEGPLHGYGVLKSAEESSGLRMGPGTIYGTLQRLQESELVREVARSESPGHVRRRYEMTPEGERALRAEARRLTGLARLVAARRLVPESEPAR